MIPGIHRLLCRVYLKNSPYSHLPPLDNVEVLFKLEKALVSDTIPTADDLHERLQQEDVLCDNILQDQQEIS